MNRQVLAVVAVAAMFATCCSPHSPSAPNKNGVGVEDLKSKTVALVKIDPDDPATGGVDPFCTGVWVSQHTVVTALHCVGKSKLGDPIDYVTPDDVFAHGSMVPRGTIMPREASLYAVDPDHDLALLRDPSPPQHQFAYVMTQPTPGQVAHTMGQPLGLWWTYSSGEVAAIRLYDLGTGSRALWVQSTTPISPGDSGGALFDAAGNVIGICRGSFRKGQLLNFFVHPIYIQTLLDAQGSAL